MVYLAIEEANELGHDRAGVEHVLLGLLREKEGVAAQVLASLGVTVEGVRVGLLETRPSSAQAKPPQGLFPFRSRNRRRGS